jgi:release factor glutamine methyltransferase
MTIREALAGGRTFLESGRIETASLDASLLLAGVLALNRSALITAGTEQITEESLCVFWELLERRRGGECIAYILGKKEFRSLDFTVNPSVLVPRPDTETLVEVALEILGKYFPQSGGGDFKTDSIRVLDLCTGSGAVAVALKNEMPELELWAADISAQALETAQINAARLLPAGSAPIHFRLGNVFEALTSDSIDEKDREISPPLFSLIVSNPPYIPTKEIEKLSQEVKKEPRIALDGGSNGLDIIKKIVAGAPGFLEPDGFLFLEADPRQMKEINKILEQANFCDIQIYQDLSGRQRVIGGRKSPEKRGNYSA